MVLEVCSKIELARSSRQASMLKFLLKWVENIELVDSQCDIFFNLQTSENSQKLKSGWGSEEATQLLLTNLFYLTIKLSSEHDAEICALWQKIAISYFNNLPIIINYLFVIISLAPDTLTPVVCIFF